MCVFAVFSKFTGSCFMKLNTDLLFFDCLVFNVHLNKIRFSRVFFLYL